MFISLLRRALAPLTSLAPALALIAALPRVSPAAELYVSPAGSDSAPGTFAAPTTLPRALVLVTPGDTIYLRGGTYAFATQITIAATNSGTDAATRKRLFAYAPPGGAPESPRLDFSTQPYGTTNNARGLQINGHYWHLRGLEVFGSADNGIYVAGNHNIVERCVTHSNRDSGLQISRASSTQADISEWPSYNLILNCDSHDNYDAPPGTGENADGFACKLTAGPGNVFRGCVARNNIDDGWDLFTKTETGPIGAVIIDQCIAYANGTLSDGTSNASGDRNGFKLGGEDIPVAHTVTRSIAFANGKNGFTWNSNPGAIRMFHNLAWNNAQGNYKFDLPAPVFLNNISLWTTGNGQNDRYGGSSGIATGPSNVFWSSSSTPKSRNDQGLQVSAASFRSLTVPTGGFARRADGALDLGDFGRLVAGSPLINAGSIPDAAYQPDLVYNHSRYYEGAADIGLNEIYLATAPFFTLSPSIGTVLAGDSVTLSAAADGTAPITYQWFHGENPVPDATDSSLTLTGITPAQAGFYTLSATNAIGSSSVGINLHVETPAAPTISIPPFSQTIPLGQSVTFTVFADGSAPLGYQWFHGLDPIATATSASLTISAVTLADAGDYSVVVTNSSGSSATATATLTVDATPIAPLITASPVNTTAISGSSATLTVAASGTPPLTYQWRRRGAPMPGETGVTLSFNPARLIDASDYDVVVTNAAGSVASAPASLLVSSAPPATLLADAFADGTRATQSLPASLAWWTSAGSGNFTATTGSASLVASSSRTVLGYFTASPAQALTLAPGQTLTFSATLRWSGFDDAATDGASNFHIGLLRSVANPAATSGTGFTAAGSPNTQARVTGDFGSSLPTSNVFSLYQGYTAFAQARTSAVAAPVAFRVRDLANASLLGSTAAFTALPGDTPLPAASLAIDTPYRVTFAVARSADGMELGYALNRVSDNALMAVGTARDPAASCTAFDTFAFFFGKAGSTPTHTITFTRADLALSSEPALDIAAWRAGWSLSGDSAADLADPDADGLPNLLEYALGLSPTLADHDPAQRPSLAPANSAEEGGFVFRYTRPKLVYDLTYLVETSPDLLVWSPAPATPVLESETPATETHRVVLPSAPSVFARLRIAPPTP